MVLLIIIPMKNGYFIGNINPTFSGPNPYGLHQMPDAFFPACSQVKQPRQHHPSCLDFIRQGDQTMFSLPLVSSGYMGVSINGGIPTWIVYKGKSDKDGWLRGAPISGNLHIWQPANGRSTAKSSWVRGPVMEDWTWVKPCQGKMTHSKGTWRNRIWTDSLSSCSDDFVGYRRPIKLHGYNPPTEWLRKLKGLRLFSGTTSNPRRYSCCC